MPLPQFLHSGMVGAPQNTNVAGSITGILDACLVTGFNVRAPDTAVCASGVTTFAYPSSHGYETRVMLRIVSTAPLLAGDRVCTATGSNTLTVPTPGLPDGPVAGALETRVAPLGWAIPFTGTNIRVYRSPNVQGSRMFYRWQDTSAATDSVRMRGYENMTTVSAGTGLFPTTAQVPGAAAVFKAVSATPEIWTLVGDDRTVYFGTDYFNQGLIQPMVFGDIQSYRPVDAYAAVVGPTMTGNIEPIALASWEGFFMPRSFSQTGGSISQTILGFAFGHSGEFLTSPSPVSGGVTFVGPVHIGTASTSMRGRFRGLTHVFERVPLTNGFAIVDATIDTPNRFVVLGSGTPGRVAFPLDTPW